MLPEVSERDASPVSGTVMPVGEVGSFEIEARGRVTVLYTFMQCTCEPMQSVLQFLADVRQIAMYQEC